MLQRIPGASLKASNFLSYPVLFPARLCLPLLLHLRMSRFIARTLLALTLSSTAAFAQTVPAGVTQPAGPEPTIGPDRPFTLEEAMALGLRKSFNLQIQGYSVENAREQVTIQDAAFVPTLSASATRGLTQAASSIDVLDGTGTVGVRRDTQGYQVGVNQRVPWTNGTVGVQVNADRAASNTRNVSINPAYNNSVRLNVTQPLLADFGKQAALFQLENAKIAFRIQTISYKSNVLDLIAQIENAYYDVVAAREALKIRQLSLESSQRLFDENTARRATGVMTDLDVLNAEVGVARGKNALVQQEQTVRDVEERLLNMINAPTLDIRPGAVAFDDYRDGVPNFGQSYKLARDFYPARLSQEETIKQLELSLANAKRSALPNLDLTASLGYTARSTDEGFYDVITSLPQEHGNNWSIGLNYSVPWGMRAEKARVRVANNNLASGKVSLEQLEANLQLSVRSAVRAIETQLLAVQLAAKNTELSTRQHDLQKSRFEAGLATAFLVLQAQDQLENDRISELNAKLSLRRAVSALRRLEGTSLERFQVQLPQ